MIFKATKIIDAAFDEKGIKHRINEAGKISAVEAGFSGDNVSGLIIRFISTDDDNDVAVRIVSFLKIPENKTSAVLNCINSLHRQYRYAKFHIDSDNEVTISMDIPVRAANVGDIAVEMFLRMAKIADDVYPAFMKAIWS